MHSSNPPDPVRPASPIAPETLDVARVMVDAFHLGSDTDDVVRLLGGVLDGLASLVQQDASGVYVVDKKGRRLRHKLFRGCDTQVVDLEAPFEGKGIVGDVLATGTAGRAQADNAPEVSVGRSCAKSRMVVPIIGASRRVLGALDVWSDLPDGYSDEAQDLVALYGSAVAGAIERARLHAEVVDKRELATDLVLARQVMQDLLPDATPKIPGFDIAGAHESSHSVGGDYYEFIPLVDERWGVVVADVVGKGIPAALLVSALRASISALVGHELAVRAVLRRANRFFYESIDASKYVTLFYAVVDPPGRRILYVNAGHSPPVLVRANGTVELLDEGGVPLGLFEAPRYFEGHVALEDGDLLALYTDGVVETAGADDDFYGVERLIAQLKDTQSASATEICSGIMQAVRRHGGSARQDDRTLVIMKGV